MLAGGAKAKKRLEAQGNGASIPLPQGRFQGKQGCAVSYRPQDGDQRHEAG